jgi:predicted alpha/beta-fold hydrolase
MRHYHRTHVTPALVLAAADDYFPTLGLAGQSSSTRSRVYAGELGTVKLSAKPEGGHYTFIEAETDQVGESRLDRNVKRFFVRVHRQADPTHKLAAAY